MPLEKMWGVATGSVLDSHHLNAQIPNDTVTKTTKKHVSYSLYGHQQIIYEIIRGLLPLQTVGSLLGFLEGLLEGLLVGLLVLNAAKSLLP